MTAARVIAVKGTRPYEVVVGHGVMGAVAGALSDTCRQVAVIHAPMVGAYAEAVAAALKDGSEIPTAIGKLTYGETGDLTSQSFAVYKWEAAKTVAAE